MLQREFDAIIALLYLSLEIKRLNEHSLKILFMTGDNLTLILKRSVL